MPNTSVVFKKKQYNSNSDNTAGTIVFDSTTNTIWMGGVQYSQIPNKTKSTIYTSFDGQYLSQGSLNYFGTNDFINSLGNNIDNSYNFIVINQSLINTINDGFSVSVRLPVVSTPYIGGENIHYFLFYNTTQNLINIATITPTPEQQNTVTLLGDKDNINISAGTAIEISIKVVGEYWIITRSNELTLAGTF